MAERVQYTCDVCGVEKKEANHWFVGQFRQTKRRKTVRDVAQIIFSRWEHARVDEGEEIHLCGQGCATRKLTEFMNSDPPERPQILARPPVEVSSTQENTEQVQPQWTPDGPILTEEPKAE